MVPLPWYAVLCASLVLGVRDHPPVAEEASPLSPLLCPPSCSCDPLPQHKAIVDCRDRGLSSMPQPLPNTTLKLYLDNNALQALGDMGPLPDLEVFSLTHNALSDVLPGVYKRSPRLKYLDLSINRLGDRLPEDTFHGLPDLLFLNLSGNYLSHISNARFQELGTLRTLDLSLNAILQIDNNAFQSLSNLQTLDLSRNRLSHLQEKWFHSLGNLQRLTLQQNRILRVSNTIFWSLGSLKEINLSHNAISRVGRLSFKGMAEVVRLDLSNNNITHMQEGTMRMMESLRQVDISYNPLLSFDGAFKSASSIQFLWLDHTERLRELTEHSLEGLSGLRHLYLSHSALSRIHPQAFTDLTGLQELHVSQTQLRSLPKEAFQPFQSLESVHLRDNPWHCDCLLHWLLRWLGDHQKGHMVAPYDTQCTTPLALRGSPILDALDHHLTCVNATAVPMNQKTNFFLGSDALLSCNIWGYPKPSLTWLTPRNVMLHWMNSSMEHPAVHGATGEHVQENNFLERLELLTNGSLMIKSVGRADTGIYRCIASNALSNSTAQVLLTLNGHFIQEIKLISIWVGLATSVAFLLLTLLAQLISCIMNRCGWECPCCAHFGSRKGQQLWRMLENMETYKSQQLDRLRDNYASQAQRVKDNCMQQMEWLRESYSSQVERLRDIRDYGTQQIDKIRDNYYSQVQKVRDYSTSQIDRLRENYIFQRTRIRKFSAHQLLKLRENYKLQQQHLNKILESLNLDSCKANCSRTDSIMFDSPELAIQSVFHNSGGLSVDLAQLRLDCVDTGSQLSAYFTPADSVSVVSSSISDKSQLNWETGPLATPLRKKRLKTLATGRRDMACSTTDLHLHLSCKSSKSLDVASTCPEVHSSAIDLHNLVPPSPPPHPISSEIATALPEEAPLIVAEPESVPDAPAPPVGEQLTEYSDHGNQDLNHLTSIECHSAPIPVQESVNETIV